MPLVFPPRRIAPGHQGGKWEISCPCPSSPLVVFDIFESTDPRCLALKPLTVLCCRRLSRSIVSVRLLFQRPLVSGRPKGSTLAFWRWAWLLPDMPAAVMPVNGLVVPSLLQPMRPTFVVLRPLPPPSPLNTPLANKAAKLPKSQEKYVVPVVGVQQHKG